MDAWLAEGLKALVAGMGTVFVVLILIAVIISLFEHLNTGENKDVSKKSVKEPEVKTEESIVADSQEKVDDLELVAVITAAIAASLNTTSDKLVVKSFRRINNKSRWNGR